MKSHLTRYHSIKSLEDIKATCAKWRWEIQWPLFKTTRKSTQKCKNL